MDEGFRDLPTVNRIVHEPSRLLILALLYPVESADYLFLLRETGLTKGNLSAHLLRLENAGYVQMEKGFRGRIPQTTYRLTDEGRVAFKEYRTRWKRTVESLPE